MCCYVDCQYNICNPDKWHLTVLSTWLLRQQRAGEEDGEENMACNYTSKQNNTHALCWVYGHQQLKLNAGRYTSTALCCALWRCHLCRCTGLKVESWHPPRAARTPLRHIGAGKPGIDVWVLYVQCKWYCRQLYTEPATSDRLFAVFV